MCQGISLNITTQVLEQGISMSIAHKYVSCVGTVICK